MQYHMISDRQLLRVPFADVAQDAERSGIHYFQIREKNLSPRELFLLARDVRARLQRTRLIINGALDVTLASGADGIHLQKGNIPIQTVRKYYPQLIIGYSAHSFDEMKEAERLGADYVFVSPVFPPISKTFESGRQPLGVATMTSWSRGIRIPVFALGGISSENVQQLIDSGCSGVAGISLFLKDGKFSSDLLRVFASLR